MAIDQSILAKNGIKRGTTGAYENTMIVGADVTHPGQGARDRSSIAAVVVTRVDEPNHYLASARL